MNSAVWAQILSAVLGVASTVAVKFLEDWLKRRAARRDARPRPLESVAESSNATEEA